MGDIFFDLSKVTVEFEVAAEGLAHDKASRSSYGYWELILDLQPSEARRNELGVRPFCWELLTPVE
jgi:hypothetical protein